MRMKRGVRRHLKKLILAPFSIIHICNQYIHSNYNWNNINSSFPLSLDWGREEPFTKNSSEYLQMENFSKVLVQSWKWFLRVYRSVWTQLLSVEKHSLKIG